jgi:hypothetical protein
VGVTGGVRPGYARQFPIGRWVPSQDERQSTADLDALVAEATVDCHDRDEQASGLYTMIADNLALPFATTVLGVEVTVADIDLTGRGEIVAICRRGYVERAIGILGLPLPLPLPSPEGAEWIAAYRHWAG